MATTGPWHLRELGLPPYADLAAVRRAYAQALRAIDPGADPDAFARLRAAYEAARAWCEQAEDEPEPPAAADDSGPDDAPPATSLMAQEADARRDAVQLGDRFVTEVRRASQADAVASLDRTLVCLRTRYVDAPGEFEERLIDLLATQALPHRAALFEAAAERFHWEHIGQTTPLAGGPWIEQVFKQREVWQQLAASRRKRWLALIAEAPSLTPRVVRHWPEIEALLASYRQWIRLYLDDDVARSWRKAFEAMPDASKRSIRHSAPSADAYRPRVKKTRQWFRLRGYGFWFIAWLAFQIVRLVVQYVDGNAVDDTPRTCMDLYHQLSRPHAYDGLTGDEIRALKQRGGWCVRNRYWPAPTP
ncbi:hypothetical protein P3W33_03335 [Luteibacter sp. PPL552]